MAEYGSKKGKKCALYLRVSLERQVEGYSLDGQKRYLQEWAEFEGMTVVDTYVDAGKSGKSIEGRDEYQRMLSDITSHRIDIDYVVVFKLSRFGRDVKDLLVTLSTMQAYGVNLICKEDGLDSSSQVGKLMITVIGAVAEMERENINTHTKLGREQKAREGGWNGGMTPFGYRLEDGKLVVNEDDAPIVRLIFDKFVHENMGYSSIAAYLNRQGIPKPAAANSNRPFNDWNTGHIKRILSCEAYMGLVVYGKTKTEKVEGTTDKYKRVQSDDFIVSDTIAHEPIISEELFQQAKVKREGFRATGRPSVGRRPKHLLSGLLRCPQCGGSMYSEPKAWKKPDGTLGQHVYYQCGHYAKAKGGQCNKNSIRGDWLEKEVIEYTKLLVQDPQFAQDIQAKIGQKVDGAEIEAEIARYQESLKKLTRSKANLERDIDAITDEDRNAERKRADMNTRLDRIYDEIYEIEDQIAECEQRRQAVERQNVTVDTIYRALQVFDKVFDKLDREEQRNVLESLISEIQLHPKETWREGKNPIKSIKYTFPIRMDGEVLFEDETHGGKMCCSSYGCWCPKCRGPEHRSPLPHNNRWAYRRGWRCRPRPSPHRSRSPN